MASLLRSPRRGRVIARLTPAAAQVGKASRPDIMKQLREIYGDYVMPEEEVRWILDHNKGRY